MRTMDERIARRRRLVTEDRAARRLRRILTLLAIAGVVALAAWFLRSPYLSIREVTAVGMSVTDPVTIAAEAGVRPGVPTIDVDGRALEARLLSEPWIATAEVAVSWPGAVSITVVEHRAVAQVGPDGAAVVVAEDGTVLEPAGDTPMPVVAIEPATTRAGERLSDRRIIGALRFVDALPPDLAAVTRVEAEGEILWATVPGHRVRLGHGIDMETKAAVLLAMLETDAPTGAVIDLIAPTRPAVRAQPELEGELPGPAKGEVSG